MITEVQEKWVLFTRHLLSSAIDIGRHAGADEPALRERAKELGLSVAGPMEHAYWDMAVSDAPHFLEIWLPVHVPAQASHPELKKVPAYKCLAESFRRPIEEIGDAWMDLGERARKMGYALTNQDREVYRVMDCDNPQNNDIGLQLGLR